MQKRAFVWRAIVGAGLIGIGCADEGAAPAPAPQMEAGGVEAISAAARSAVTQFFVPPPDAAAVSQITGLLRQRDFDDAVKLAEMEATPRAVWFESGTPREVERSVRQTMDRATAAGRVPVLVAYNIPFRDCAQYSSGGAVDTASYEAWIDGFAAGIGKRKAVVILEPDSLGIIPWSGDWCKPTVTDSSGSTVNAPGADPASRYAQLNYAVDRLAAIATGARVYLDGTHSGWLAVGDASTRLASAGVARAEGFFLNISNYQITGNLAQYGTWISECLAYATSVTPGDFGSCPSQYWNGGPLPSKIAQINGEWNGTAMDGNGAWSDSSETVALNTSGINLRYANMLGTTAANARFVIDTSRNGHGPLDSAQYAVAPYDQPANVTASLTAGNWCNPPGAGLGLRPTASTGIPLLAAYLWVKTPGESDGACAINGGARAWDFTAYNPWNVTGDAQNAFDPLWGTVDPAAGAWFPAQALQLAQEAVPALL